MTDRKKAPLAPPQPAPDELEEIPSQTFDGRDKPAAPALLPELPPNTDEAGHVLITEDALELEARLEAMLARNYTEVEELVKSRTRVPDGNQYETVAAVGIEAAEIARQYEAQRLRITRPIDARKALVMGRSAPIAALLKVLTDGAKQAMYRHDSAVREAARKAQAELDEKARKEREKLTHRADVLEDAGHVEKSDNLRDKAATTIAPVVRAAVPTVAGVAKGERWDFEITNPNLVPAEYLVPNESAIRAAVKSRGDYLHANGGIPGVRMFKVAAGAFRGARRAE